METKVQSQFDSGYIFDKREITTALSPRYLAFLKEAGIVDIRKTPNLFVAQYVLRRDKKVEKEAKKAKINCSYDDEGRATYISQPNARRLIHRLGGIILPTAITYKLIIPKLKEAEDENNAVKKTLEEMAEFAEWQEDLFRGETLKVGRVRTRVDVLREATRFSIEDLNNFGYPTIARGKGEFKYFSSVGNERAAIRDGDPELGLDLSGVHLLESNRLGVRFAKFF